MADGIHSLKIKMGDIELSVKGSQEFVEEEFFKLYEKHNLNEVELGDMNVSKESTSLGFDEEKITDEEEDENSAKPPEKTLNEYLANSDASTLQDNALAVGWYLEYAVGQDDFIAPEVEDEAQNNKIKLGANVKRDLDKNVEKGYLHSPGERDGSDTYWVTNTGEEYLEEMGIPVP